MNNYVRKIKVITLHNKHKRRLNLKSDDWILVISTRSDLHTYSCTPKNLMFVNTVTSGRDQVVSSSTRLSEWKIKIVDCNFCIW